MKLKPQAEAVMDAMKRRGSLSVREAQEFGCFRLAARVKEIREAYGDAAVLTEREEHNGGSHARYVWRAQGSVQTALTLD